MGELKAMEKITILESLQQAIETLNAIDGVQDRIHDDLFGQGNTEESKSEPTSSHVEGCLHQIDARVRRIYDRVMVHASFVADATKKGSVSVGNALPLRKGRHG